MKRFSIFLILLCIGLGSLNAQSNRQDNRWALNAGPVIALPNKFLHNFHSFGVGADFSALHAIKDGWSAGGRANYVYFFGKQSSNLYGPTVSSHYDATHIFNILAEVNYLFQNNFMVGVDLGLGLSLTHVYVDASFARIAYVAYQLSLKKPILVALYFDETNFQKNFGLRVGFSI